MSRLTFTDIMRMLNSLNDERFEVNKKVMETYIEMTKTEIKYCDSNLEGIEGCLEYARKCADKDNDLDILFDEIDYILPFKKQFTLLKQMYKMFYVIEICILHKKIEGILEKIEEIRPLFYELDEMMTNVLKINNDGVVGKITFNEDAYIKHSQKFKTINELLDDFKNYVKDGYTIIEFDE